MIPSYTDTISTFIVESGSSTTVDISSFRSFPSVKEEKAYKERCPK